jgi:hypothetical protein
MTEPTKTWRPKFWGATLKETTMSDLSEGSDSPKDLLELDLSPEETALAQLPNDLTNLSSDSTHPLTEAPTPAGAILESAPLLEPILAARPTDSDDQESQVLIPAFMRRLSLAKDPTQVKVKRESPNSFSLAAGDNWPVFLLRAQWLGPLPSRSLKALATAARKLGGDRVYLGLITSWRSFLTTVNP